VNQVKGARVSWSDVDNRHNRIDDSRVATVISELSAYVLKQPPSLQHLQGKETRTAPPAGGACRAMTLEGFLHNENRHERFAATIFVFTQPVDVRRFRWSVRASARRLLDHHTASVAFISCRGMRRRDRRLG
jgi:hypothetical protein